MGAVIACEDACEDATEVREKDSLTLLTFSSPLSQTSPPLLQRRGGYSSFSLVGVRCPLFYTSFLADRG